MEKLIKLLNEYEGDADNPTWTLSGANEPLYGGWTAYASAYLIPSKKYGFIKRLVDNHKLEPLEIEIGTCMEAEINGGKYRLYRDTYKDYDSLLMYLAIHDQPLKYLCSILS